MNTAKMLYDAFVNDGGTYRLRHAGTIMGYEWEITSHSDGFYVSRPRGVENLPEQAITVDLIERIVAERHLYSGLYLGLWKDDHGNWSVDETEWVPYRLQALNIGVRNNQRSIWDVQKSEAVSIELAGSLV